MKIKNTTSSHPERDSTLHISKFNSIRRGAGLHFIEIIQRQVKHFKSQKKMRL